MAKINVDLTADPTLEAMDDVILAEKQKEKPRQYLGASQIGEPCRRKLFYSFRYAEKKIVTRKNSDPDEYWQELNRIKAAEDGHYTELVIINNLRKIEGIEIHNDDGTVDGEGKQNQIGFKMLLDHFRGHVDFVVLGLKQAPKTWHVGEVKCKLEKFFNALEKLKQKNGEKNALEEWSEEYYGQAIILMHALQMERHYLVCSTPGGRAQISVRTDYSKQKAENLIAKAQSIIFDNWDLPARLSEKREFFKCGWCEYKELCFDGKFPLVHCKTCRYMEPVKDGQFHCYKHENLIDDEILFSGCDFHVYNPALIHAELIEHQDDGCLYKYNGLTFGNFFLTGLPELKGECHSIFTSAMLRNDVQFLSKIAPHEPIEKPGTKKWDKRLKA
jgi:hypothetical protein